MLKTMEIDEKKWLFALAKYEELAEKKTKIYSRLLTETSLAKEMEELSLRHEKRKNELLLLSGEKIPKRKNGKGMCEMNEEDSEK